MYKILLDFVPKPGFVSSKMIAESSSNNNEIKWDSTKCGTGVVFENNKTLAFLKEQSYVFRSVTTINGFMGGVHYWEIVADNKTEN
jgi:hypothetical protein